MNEGKVWLVGAGPGDVGLLTVKGQKVLLQADVVVYDALVGKAILAMIPQRTRCINVGKRAGKHTLAQEKINQILLEEAQAGNRVVRLKGGDPFLFGRGGEELELIAENHIPYEVVPGVPSPLAVSAYGGIPVTHRDYCSSLHIITGHKKAGDRLEIDFDALVRVEGTLVFLMGIHSLSDICRGLLEAGMKPKMPAAVIGQGTTAGQKKIVSTIADIHEEVQKQGILTPAIIIVGAVCQLAEELSWYEKLPLAGHKVIVTRPKQHSSVMAEKLRSQGAEVLEIPAIATVPIAKRPIEMLGKLHLYDWIVFTSPTGVEIFFNLLLEEGIDIRRIGNAKLAAIGSGTGNALKEKGFIVDLIPEIYDGDELGRELAAVCTGGERILLPRARNGNTELVRHLTDAGALVDDIATYDTVCQKSNVIDIAAEVTEGGTDCVVFTSASTVRGFVNAMPDGFDYSHVRAACIGKQTQAAADEYGMQTYVAEQASLDSLVNLVQVIARSH